MSDRLTEIRERAEKATPGPWREYHDDIWLEDMTEAIATDDCSGAFLCRDDASFCAHAREDIPFLLAEVERLEKDVKEWHNLAMDAASDLLCLRDGSHWDSCIDAHIKACYDKENEDV